jgi:hypothetical protein
MKTSFLIGESFHESVKSPWPSVNSHSKNVFEIIQATLGDRDYYYFLIYKMI